MHYEIAQQNTQDHDNNEMILANISDAGSLKDEPCLIDSHKMPGETLQGEGLQPSYTLNVNEMVRSAKPVRNLAHELLDAGRVNKLE